MKISVIIPCYNAADWLPKTIPRVCIALKTAAVNDAEIIVVDDGSSDESARVAQNLKIDYPLKVVTQKNKGRLIARQLGIKNAKYEFVLLIDTRVFIEKDALKYVKEMIAKHPTNTIWTSHVNIDKKGNIYARFWDAITCMAWRKYFRSPAYITFGAKNFDSYPKGTTCLFLPKQLFAEATDWYIENNKNHNRDSNDDTTILRKIAEKNKISISPQYASTYHARTNFKKFYGHTYHRGKVFVDGFFVRGNVFYYPIMFFLLFSIPLLVLMAYIVVKLFWVFLAIMALYVFAIFVVFRLNKISLGDIFSFILLFPVFFIAYGSGIWTAFLQKNLKLL